MEFYVEHLAVARGGLCILQGMGFTLSAGRALVLRGANGIGKTTLLRTLAGLQPKLSGTIGYDFNLVAYNAHLDGVKAALTVAENLRFWAAIYGAPSIEPALDMMNLHDLQGQMGAHLSAGQKRRVGLARLTLTQRPVWLLDEPTVSLDGSSVQLFAAMLRGHLQTGGCAVLATHIDLGLPEATALDLTPYSRPQSMLNDFDEAFL